MKAAALLILLCVWTVPVYGRDEDFSSWLDGFRREAVSSGIRTEVFDAAMYGVQPVPRIIELDRKQPEAALTLKRYLRNSLPAARIRKGRALLSGHRALLEEISARYGVQPEYIVALWGIETDFGANTGGFYAPEALATLAYDGRRSAYFRAELLAALKILDDGDIPPADMNGSWAGALGQTQFMPSSYLKFAVDYDGDGATDIWNSRADIFASIANYLAQSGWNTGRSWGKKVSLPANSPCPETLPEEEKILTGEAPVGITGAAPPVLSGAGPRGWLVCPGGRAGGAYLVLDNYRVLLKWNRSLYFALAAGLLADELLQN